MASTSQQSQEKDRDQADGCSKIKVTILASEWGSSKGGLSTINRELAIQLAKCPEMEITFFLPKCSEEDKNIALRHKIEIVEATRRPGYDELEWLSFPPENLQIDVIVGHGVKLGRQAQVIRFSKKSRWVQVVHTDPEELGMFKNYLDPISKGEEKHKTEVELCEMADLVVGVGPKLSEAFRSYLRGCQNDLTVLDFTPGVFDEFGSVKQAPNEGKNCSVLVFGRGDAEDFEVKGFDIAGKAVATLPNTRLVFVGAPDGKYEEIAQRFTGCGIPASCLRVRGYMKSREDLKRLFQEVDLVLMPSRTEGFGLTGLEALSAGCPVLVSENSGFGEALSKVPFGSSFVVDSEDPKVWAEAIKRIWNKDRQGRLEEAEMLRSSYDKKYSWAKQSKDLVDKMISIVHGASDVNADAPQERVAGIKCSAECLQDERVMKESVESLKSDLADLRQPLTQIEAKKQSSTILQISPDIADCKADITFFADRYDPDTRQWLFEDFDKWFSDPGDSRAYVLLGDAGIGKSVMAGALAQRTRKAGHLGAAYFCRHYDGTRKDPRYLLGTVACQLCDCNSQYSNLVGGEGCVSTMLTNSKLGVHELFTKLLEEPLSNCDPCQERKLVIIDALDETEYESREEFLYLVKERFPRLPNWLVFFITSRPEDKVQSRLVRYNPCVRICAGNIEQRSLYQQHEQDIQRFLQKEVVFSRLPYSVEEVTKKCNGLFLYAFYIANVLKDSVHSGKIDQLSQLSDFFPGNIEDYFRENFQRVFTKVGADLYKKLFGCIITAPAPLPVSFISFVLNRENSNLEEQDVTDAVSLFVVQRTSDQTVTFLHNLIPAWLTNKKKAEKLFIDKKFAGEYLRSIFIQILSHVVEEPTETLQSVDVDLQSFVLHVAVRFLCKNADKDSLKVVFSCLTSYRFLEKRIRTGRITVYHLLEDLKLAIDCFTVEEAQKQNILQEISLALETDVHVLLECPHLLRSCIRNASNVVQNSILVPQVSVPWMEWIICDISAAEILSECNCFATASDRKTVAAAKGLSLFFVDSSSLQTVSGPFEISQDTIKEIRHLEFSSDDKFVFFGRLDKWFSIKRGCVEDLPQFIDNSIDYEWCLLTSDGQAIVVENNCFFDRPQSCREQFCITELLALWAMKEIDESQDDQKTCSFSGLERMVAKISNMGGQMARLLEFLQINPTLYRTHVKFVPDDPTCYYCERLRELTVSNQESSLATVRQLIIELYPRIFRHQVWNLQTGKPFLYDIFYLGAQFNSFTYFCHVTSAFEEQWMARICSGADKAFSVCNIAVVNAISVLLKRREGAWVWQMQLKLERERKREQELERKREWELVLEQTLVLNRKSELERKGRPKWEWEWEWEWLRGRESELAEELEQERERERRRERVRRREREQVRVWEQEREWRKLYLDLELFCNSCKSGLFINIPNGFLDLVGTVILPSVSPVKKWVAVRKKNDNIYLLQTGIQGKGFCKENSGKQEHSIGYAVDLTFTTDDLYVVFSSHAASLHALSLQTGTIFTSVSGLDLFYFTKEKRFGYLFRSGTEERAIFLTNLCSHFKFLQGTRPMTSEVGKSITAIFISSDAVMSVSSDLTVTLWNTPNEERGITFKFIASSSLPASRSFEKCVPSPNGKLVVIQQRTKIDLYSVAPSKRFHYAVFEADDGFTDVCLTFSSDGTFLFFCIQDNFSEPHFYVWDVQKKAMSVSFKSPGLLAVECFCLSSDKRNLILCGEYEIEVWEFATLPGRLLKRSGVKRFYNPVKFSQCTVSLDNELLVCCIANAILIYDLRVADFHSSKRVLRGHLSEIEFCKFLRVNRYLISCGVDGMVFLWDIIDSRAAGFARITQGQENIVSMAVSPEEDRVICFLSSDRVCAINLCELDCALSSELLKAPTKGRVNTAETSLQQAGPIASTSKIATSSVEDYTAGAFRSPDLEERFLLTPDDLLDSDESDHSCSD